MSAYQQLFDDAIGYVPPSAVDLDTVITRGRRRARNRRVGAVALGLVLAGGVSGTFAILPTRAPMQPAAPTTDATSRNYTKALQRSLLEMLPAARFHDVNSGADGDTPEFVHRYRPQKDLGSSSVQLAEDYYIATADVTDADGVGRIEVGVGVDSPDTGWELQHTCTDDEKPLDVPSYDCKPQVGPHDETIIAVAMRKGSSLTYRVNVTKRDGTGVIVTVANQATKDSGQSVGTRHAPPLTLNQAVDLALDPAFTVKP